MLYAIEITWRARVETNGVVAFMLPYLPSKKEYQRGTNIRILRKFISRVNHFCPNYNFSKTTGYEEREHQN